MTNTRTMTKMNTPHIARPPGRPRKPQARGPQYDPVTVQLPPDLIAALDAATDAAGLDSRSALIHHACRTYLKRTENLRRTHQKTDGAKT